MVFPPKFLARYEEGDIIGTLLGSVESTKKYNWLVTQCSTVVAVFTHHDFEWIWKWQGKFNVNADK